MKKILLVLMLILSVSPFVTAKATEQQAQRNQICSRQQLICISNCKDSKCMENCYNTYMLCINNYN